MHAGTIEIWHGGECVAQRERCFGKYQKVLDLQHYLDALVGEPGALEARRRWNSGGHRAAGR